MTSPVTTGLQKTAIALFLMILLLTCIRGEGLGNVRCLRWLSFGRKFRLGLLVQSWILTVRLWRWTVLRVSGRCLLVVTWSRYLMRLRLAITLAIGRLIRRCAPTLTKQKLLCLLMTNLIALVPMQLSVCFVVIVVLFTVVWCLGARNGEGALLTTPRQWCRVEYLCLFRRTIRLRVLLKTRNLTRCGCLTQCLSTIWLWLKVPCVLCR